MLVRITHKNKAKVRGNNNKVVKGGNVSPTVNPIYHTEVVAGHTLNDHAVETTKPDEISTYSDHRDDVNATHHTSTTTD